MPPPNPTNPPTRPRAASEPGAAGPTVEEARAEFKEAYPHLDSLPPRVRTREEILASPEGVKAAAFEEMLAAQSGRREILMSMFAGDVPTLVRELREIANTFEELAESSE